MKIKVRNKIYDGKEEPIMIILTKEDKDYITNMLINDTKYCEFPESFSMEEIIEFMKIKDND